MSQSFEQQLTAGMKAMGFSVADKQTSQLISYLELLIKWNKAYNLTAIREPERMLAMHLLDSVSVSTHLSGDRFIDVGTGPGLPGIPLAILHPEKTFLLLDSNGKKVRFLFQAISSLGLANVSEIQTRVESYQPEQLFDVVLSRAYASIEDMLTSCRHLLRPNGHFLAMKGKYPKTELSELPKDYIVNGVQPLSVPGVEGERHLVDICFSEECP